MAWTATEGSHVFRAFMSDVVTRALAHDIDTDAVLAALFTNTGTPDRNVTSALSGYNAATSQWVVANEVSQAGQWAAGGIALAGRSVDSTVANTVFFDATDTASGAAATLANVYGVLVYDNTLAGKNGICFNYLGGANSVTAGTFTVVWNANGIWRATV